MKPKLNSFGWMMTKDTLPRVVECIATTTRYPHSLLVADADLENDLGIDSVKRLEIVVALESEFGLPLSNEPRDPSIRTINDIGRWIDEVTNRERSGLESADDAQCDCSSGDCDDQNHVFHASESRIGSGPHFPTHRREEEPIAVSKPLKGKVALVTGSGRGIGQTIARVLAARGATVVINSFHSRELGDQTTAEIRSQGGSAEHLWGSVAKPSHVEHMFEEIKRLYGHLDILVCNSSDGRIGPFMEIGHDDWDRAFRTNVSGHHHCAIKAAELMEARGGGSIVTMSAVGAKGFVEGLGCQGVVKAAVETLTRYLACELGPSGIRVNCVAGGPVYGDLISKFPNAQATQNHWESMSPDGKLTSPLDLANAIAFLVSDEARGISGSVWTVDHGFSAMADGRPTRMVTKEGVLLGQ